MENYQTSPFEQSSKVFHGVRFVLLGFDIIKKAQVSRKLVDGGAVDAGLYGPNCTHVIVDKVAYDDPVCVAARRDGKILVSALWVNHSFDMGKPVNPTSVMYRPARDLNGIPGAKSLVICLTGYQRDDREDIMNMVEVMGARFSKPLIANKVTHLICYKFEGDKYLLAKKMKTIKLINHRWLEDCIKAWELISEADYSKSGYELEMEAEAKDSEDEAEAEGVTTRYNNGIIASPHHSLVSKQEVPKTVSTTSASKGVVNAEEIASVTMKTTSDQFISPHKITSNIENVIGVTCKPSNLFEGTTSGSAAQNNFIGATTSANKSPLNEANKVTSASYSSKVPMRTTPPTVNTYTSNTSSAKRLDKLNLSDAFNISPSLVEKANDEQMGSSVGQKGPAFGLEDAQKVSSPGKRKMDASSGNFKLKKTSHAKETSNRESPHVESVFQELQKDPLFKTSTPEIVQDEDFVGTDIPYLNDGAAISPAQKSPSNITARLFSGSKAKNVNSPLFKTSTPEIVQDEDFVAVPKPLEDTTRLVSGSKAKNVHSPLFKTSTSENVQDENFVAVPKPLEESRETSLVTEFDSRGVGMVENVMQGHEQSSSAVSSGLQKSSTSAGSNSKPVRRKSLAKKFSAPNQNPAKKKIVNQKGSIFLKKNEPINDATASMVDVQELGDDENVFEYQKIEKVLPEAKSVREMEMEMEGNDGMQIDNLSEYKSLCMDDETEPPEDTDKDGEPENTVDIVVEEKAEGDVHDVGKSNEKEDIMSIQKNILVDKSDVPENLVSDMTPKGKKRGKKRTAVSVKEVSNKKAAKMKGLSSDRDNGKLEIRDEASAKTKSNMNDLENSMEVKRAEGDCNDPERKNDGQDDMEIVMNKKATKRNSRSLSKTKKDAPISIKEAADKKDAPISIKEAADKKDAETTELLIHKNNEKSVIEEAVRQEAACSDLEHKNDEQDDIEIVANKKGTKRNSRSLSKAKKDAPVSVKEATDKKDAEMKELASHKNNEKPEIEETFRQEAACSDPEHKNDEKDDTENAVNTKATKRKKRPASKAKKDAPISIQEATDKKDAEKTELASHKNNEKPEIEETIRQEAACSDPEHKNDEEDDTENVVDTKVTKRKKRLASKTKKNTALSEKDVTDAKAAQKKGKQTSSGCDLEAQKENIQLLVDDQITTSTKQVVEKITRKPVLVNSDAVKDEPMWFILTGNQLQRRELQQIIRRLKGRVCRVSHQWSYQATHYIVPEPIKRNEKFFAAAASGRWILKTDYLSASNQAGKFVTEEPYEWHKNGLSEDGQINLEAPRKWRLLKEKTGHGAFYGMRIVIYGECIAPTLDTLKRAIKAGDGTILATSPPYTRFLTTDTDFAIISPGMPHVDIWVQEFIKHEIPCISADYLVEYVCKPGYPLEKHVLYDTNVWAERSYNNLKKRLNDETFEPRTPEGSDVACEVCGSRDRGEEMLICGDESGLVGCGVGTHIDCCDPPFDDIPENDWFCNKCSKAKNSKTPKKSSKRKGKSK